MLHHGIWEVPMLDARQVAEVMGGEAVLGFPVASLADLQAAVERGLPTEALRAVARRLFPDSANQRSTIHGVVPPATLKRRKGRLSLVESERTERLARILAIAEDVLGDRAEAHRFLTTAHPLLDDRLPWDAAATDLGARRVEQVLRSIEHGLPV